MNDTVTRDMHDEILAAWARLLTAQGHTRNDADCIALDLAGICAARGVQLVAEIPGDTAPVGGFCDFHAMPRPCHGCAADAKAMPDRWTPHTAIEGN
jgi:hypothetical protein